MERIRKVKGHTKDTKYFGDYLRKDIDNSGGRNTDRKLCELVWKRRHKSHRRRRNPSQHGKNTREVQQKQSSTRVGANIGVKSEIKNTFENLRNPKSLIDTQGNVYGVINTASKLTGAIKDGAKVTNSIISKK